MAMAKGTYPWPNGGAELGHEVLMAVSVLPRNENTPREAVPWQVFGLMGVLEFQVPRVPLPSLARPVP